MAEAVVVVEEIAAHGNAAIDLGDLTRHLRQHPAHPRIRRDEARDGCRASPMAPRKWPSA
jgi:hypothetical protein